MEGKYQRRIRMEWQSIDTAPKDGTKILVFCIHGEIEISEWYESWQSEYVKVEGTEMFTKRKTMYYEGWNSNSFLHWQPLPEPPEK